MRRPLNIALTGQARAALAQLADGEGSTLSALIEGVALAGPEALSPRQRFAISAANAAAHAALSTRKKKRS